MSLWPSDDSDYPQIEDGKPLSNQQLQQVAMAIEAALGLQEVHLPQTDEGYDVSRMLIKARSSLVQAGVRMGKMAISNNCPKMKEHCMICAAVRNQDKS